MDGRPSRRAVLGSISAAVGASLSGCAQAPVVGPETEQSPAGPGPEDVAESPNRVNFYLVNKSETPREVRVHIERTSGSVVLDRTYNVPAELGLVIRDVARVGRSYRVRVDAEEMTSRDGPYEWTVTECAGPGDQEQSGSVIIQKGNLAFHKNRCEPLNIAPELEFQNASRYRANESGGSADG